VHVHRYYAYVDRIKKEWDFTRAVDLCDDEHNLRQSDEEREKFQNRQRPVIEAWSFLPKALQAIFAVDGLLPYARIAAVDEKGDVLYDCPHIYVDSGESGPYDGWWETLEVGGEKIHLAKEFKRVKILPESFKELEPPRPAKSSVALDEQTMRDFIEYKDVGVLYAVDGRYKKLKQRDVVSLKGAAPKSGEQPFLQITYVGYAKVGEYLNETREPYKYRSAIRQQVGKEVADDDSITYLEYRRYYKRPKDDNPMIVVPEE
jgi:hypothetical protein